METLNPSAMDDNSDSDWPVSDGEDVQSFIDPFWMDLPEVNNICLAAYKEIMTIALEADTWVQASPALGSQEDFLQMFRSPPPPGMRVELSIESAVLPIHPNGLITIMMDAWRWSSSLFHLVCNGSNDVPPGILQHLSTFDLGIIATTMIDAKFQLPAPFEQRRHFRFFRFLKKIMEDIWAIIDVSIDYFPHVSASTLGHKCRRRPSGLILRRCDHHSQVIWIENVEVPQCQLQDSIYASIINSNTAFSAKHCVNTFIWGLNRNYRRRLMTAKMAVTIEDHDRLRKLTECMKSIYLDIVRESHDESQLVTLSNENLRILRTANLSGSFNYVAVTSFRVQAEPLSVFKLLVKKNVKSHRSSSLDFGEPQEVIKSVSGVDDSYCITLYEKDEKYLLQEASRDGFCSFIISAPMTLTDMRDCIYSGRCRPNLFQPSGFAIMADRSDASLVTIARQQEMDVPETDQTIEYIRNTISTIIKEICEEVNTRA